MVYKWTCVSADLTSRTVTLERNSTDGLTSFWKQVQPRPRHRPGGNTVEDLRGILEDAYRHLQQPQHAATARHNIEETRKAFAAIQVRNPTPEELLRRHEEIAGQREGCRNSGLGPCPSTRAHSSDAAFTPANRQSRENGCLIEVFGQDGSSTYAASQ